MTDKIKTLAECKDQIVQEYNYDNWDNFENCCVSGVVMNEMWKDAYELYASPDNVKKVDLKTSPIYDLQKIQEYLQTEPVSGDVETIAQNKSEIEFPYDDFRGKEKGVDDEKTGMALRGAYVQGFEECAKWKSQQPLTIPWLSDEDVDLWFKENHGISEEMETHDGMIKFFYANHIPQMIIDFQEQLQKLVNSVDPIDFAIWFEDNVYIEGYLRDNEFGIIGSSEKKLYSRTEILQIYLSEKQKQHEKKRLL